MKKYLLSLLAISMVAAMSVCFTSCGPDNNPDPVVPQPPVTPVTPTNSLIGTWKFSWDDEGEEGFALLTFNENGTVLYQEYDDGKWEEEGETMKYTYSNGILSFYSDGKDNPETATVVSLTATTLVLRDWPDNGDCTFTKVTTPTPTVSIVGTWKCTYSSDEYDILTFNSNGTGELVSVEGEDEDRESFTYTYSGDKITLKFGSGEVETFDVESLTATTLVVIDEDAEKGIFYKQ